MTCESHSLAGLPWLSAECSDLFASPSTCSSALGSWRSLFHHGQLWTQISTRCQSPITQGEVSSKATAQSLLGNRVQMLPARDPSLHPINLRSLITSLVILSQMSSPLLTYSFTDSHLHTSLCLFIPYLLFFPPIIFLLSQSLLVSSDTAIPLVALSCFYSPNLFHCKSTSPNL